MASSEIRAALCAAIDGIRAEIDNASPNDLLTIEALLVRAARTAFDGLVDTAGRYLPDFNWLSSELVAELLPSRSLMLRPELVRAYLRRRGPFHHEFELDGRPCSEDEAEDVLWWYMDHGLLESLIPGVPWRLKRMRRKIRTALRNGARSYVEGTSCRRWAQFWAHTQRN